MPPGPVAEAGAESVLGAVTISQRLQRPGHVGLVQRAAGALVNRATRRVRAALGASPDQSRDASSSRRGTSAAASEGHGRPARLTASVRQRHHAATCHPRPEVIGLGTCATPCGRGQVGQLRENPKASSRRPSPRSYGALNLAATPAAVNTSSSARIGL